MADSTTGHPDHQTSHIPASSTFPVPPFCSLIDQLIECRIHVICKLYLRNRLHPLRRAADAKANDTLFAQGSIEHSFRSKLRCKVHAAPKDTPERNIFTKNQDSVIGAEGMRQGAVDGLEEVESFGRGVAGEVGMTLEGSRGVVEERMGRIVYWEVEAGICWMGRVCSSL